MLYFKKNNQVIGKLSSMPPGQYAQYLADGYERCNEDGSEFDKAKLKAEKEDYAKRAKVVAANAARLAKLAKEKEEVDALIKKRLLNKK